MRQHTFHYYLSHMTLPPSFNHISHQYLSNNTLSLHHSTTLFIIICRIIHYSTTLSINICQIRHSPFILLPYFSSSFIKYDTLLPSFYHTFHHSHPSLYHSFHKYVSNMTLFLHHSATLFINTCQI